MSRSAAAIPPRDLVDAYVAAGGKKTAAAEETLCDAYGEKTAQVMADGARVLSRIGRPLGQRATVMRSPRVR